MVIAQISDTHIICPSIGSNKIIGEERIRNLIRCANTIKNLVNKCKKNLNPGGKIFVFTLELKGGLNQVTFLDLLLGFEVFFENFKSPEKPLDFKAS